MTLNNLVSLQTVKIPTVDDTFINAAACATILDEPFHAYQYLKPLIRVTSAAVKGRIGPIRLSHRVK